MCAFMKYVKTSTNVMISYSGITKRKLATKNLISKSTNLDFKEWCHVRYI